VNDAIRHLRQMPNVDLHVVELAYGDRPWEVTGGHPHDVQLRTSCELWHKEQLINVGVSHFPADWRYGAYVDGDFHFTRHDLALEAIHQLQHYDFVQLFSQYADLSGKTYGTGNRVLRVNNGFAYNYVQRGFQLPDGFGHGGWRVPGCPDDPYGYEMSLAAAPTGVGATGGAWAFRRSAFDIVGGMLDGCILGHADWFQTFGLVGEDAPDMHVDGYTSNYREHIASWQKRAARLKKNIGYVDAFATHGFHGAKSKRGYSSRDLILVKHAFDPVYDLRRDWQGIWELTPDKPGLRDDIRRYFATRGEDDPNPYADAPRSEQR
jgi:hypothetical protein